MFKDQGTISTDDGLDSAFASGTYRIMGGTLSAGFDDGILKVFNRSGENGITVQEFINYENSVRKQRIKWYSNAWKPWVGL